MKIECSLIFTECPMCSNAININKVWYPGGANDYGVFILECTKCKYIFEVNVGRDVDVSSVQSGAKLIERKYRQ